MHIINASKTVTGEAIDLEVVGESGYCVDWFNGTCDFLRYEDLIERKHKGNKYLEVINVKS